MIWDCFPFFNELDLLELRCETLKSVVDRHVLVESVKTHSGQDKPLYFELNRERFRKYPIVHVVVRQPPTRPDEWAARRHPDHPMAWTRENHQRDTIMEALKDAPPEDIVLLSDCDEIPRPECMPECIDVLRSGKQRTVIFWLRTYYYFMNFQQRAENWFLATRATLKRELISPMHLRWEMNAHVIKDAGWHFSWLGGQDGVSTKIRSFAHQEYNRPEITEGNFIQTCIKLRKTFHSMRPLDQVPFDESYPAYVRDHPEIYGRYFAEQV